MPNYRVARPRIRMNSHPSNGSSLRITFTSSKQVRSKFFQKIGTLCPAINKTPQVPVSERSVRDLSNIPRHHEPLNRRRSNNIMSCDEPKVKQQKRRGVSFHEHVTVVPWVCVSRATCISRCFYAHISYVRSHTIVCLYNHFPLFEFSILLRSDYSTKIKSKLWTNKLENLESVGKSTGLIPLPMMMHMLLISQLYSSLFPTYRKEYAWILCRAIRLAQLHSWRANVPL